MASRVEAERADAQIAHGREARGAIGAAGARDRGEMQATAQQMAREGTEARTAPLAREPFGAGEQQLAHPPIPGYRLYWFNDTPGRIERAERAGYAHVDDRHGHVARNVGRGERDGGLRAYLMKIPMEWYEEDMAKAEDQLNSRLRDIRDGRHNLQPGQNQYVPTRGIKIEEENRR